MKANSLIRIAQWYRHGRVRHPLLAIHLLVLLVAASVWTPYHLASHDHHSPDCLHIIAERLADDHGTSNQRSELKSDAHNDHCTEGHEPHHEDDPLAYWLSCSAIVPAPDLLDLNHTAHWPGSFSETAVLRRAITPRGRAPPPGVI